MASKEIIKCPSCGSQKTKMRTPITGAILISLSAGAGLIDFAVTRTLDTTGLPGLIIVFILGLMFWFGNTRAICTECNKKFKISDELKFAVRCPNCSRKLKGATEKMIGDTGICPKCKTEFEIKRQ